MTVLLKNLFTVHISFDSIKVDTIISCDDEVKHAWITREYRCVEQHSSTMVAKSSVGYYSIPTPSVHFEQAPQHPTTQTQPKRAKPVLVCNIYSHPKSSEYLSRLNKCDHHHFHRGKSSFNKYLITRFERTEYVYKMYYSVGYGICSSTLLPPTN